MRPETGLHLGALNMIKHHLCENKNAASAALLIIFAIDIVLFSGAFITN
jgi:ABC-type uncharacterized transport system ATPase subunit